MYTFCVWGFDILRLCWCLMWLWIHLPWHLHSWEFAESFVGNSVSLDVLSIWISRVKMWRIVVCHKHTLYRPTNFTRSKATVEFLFLVIPVYKMSSKVKWPLVGSSQSEFYLCIQVTILQCSCIPSFYRVQLLNSNLSFLTIQCQYSNVYSLLFKLKHLSYQTQLCHCCSS